MTISKKVVIGMIIIVGIVLSTVQFSLAANPGHPWIQMDCDTTLCASSTALKVGMGTSIPSAKLQINPAASTEGLRIISASNWSPLNIQNSGGADIFRVDQSGILQVGSVPWTRLTTFPSACSVSGQYVTGVGSTLACTAEVGDISDVGAGTGLTGGGPSGSVILNVIGGGGITSNADNIQLTYPSKSCGSNAITSFDLSNNNSPGCVSIPVDTKCNTYNSCTQVCIGTDCRNVWPAAGVTGSGSTNYISKWTGGTSLGNSSIYDNGNVGIGTTVNSYKLHVAGDIYANGGWLRTSGNAGWYSESYGGGWWMTDATWLRAYSDKWIYTGGEMQAGTVRGNSYVCIGSDCRSSWPAAGVTGSGTSGYLPVWTGGSSIGNSSMYYSGGHYGLTNGATISFQGTSVNTTAFALYGSNAETVLNAPDGTAINFKIGNNTRATLDSSGYLYTKAGLYGYCWDCAGSGTCAYSICGPSGCVSAPIISPAYKSGYWCVCPSGFTVVLTGQTTGGIWLRSCLRN